MELRKGWLQILSLMHFFLMFLAMLSLRVMTFTAQSFRIIVKFGTLTTVYPGVTKHRQQYVAERSLEILIQSFRIPPIFLVFFFKL